MNEEERDDDYIPQHPRYECGADECFCHAPEFLDQYLDYLDYQEMTFDPLDRRNMQGWSA